MLEVFSMTRAGKPKAAIVATAALLAITTAGAALTARQKTRASEVTMTEAKLYGALGLRARLPAGWGVEQTERFGNGRILVATGSGRDSGRQIAIFQGRSSLGMARVAREAVLFMLPDGAQIGGAREKGTGTVGSLESALFVFAALSEGEIGGFGVANVAVTPEHRFVGVALVNEGELSSRDSRLLEEVSDSVTLESGPKPGATPADHDPSVEPERSSEDEGGRPLASL